MALFVVSYISFHENVIETELVEAASWQEALPKHSKLGQLTVHETDTLSSLKSTWFDNDFTVDIKQLVLAVIHPLLHSIPEDD